MQLVLASTVAISIAASTAYAFESICSTGLYAQIRPLAADPAFKSFCSLRYLPGTSTILSTSVITPATLTITTVSTSVTTSTSTVTSITTTTSTATFDPALKKRNGIQPCPGVICKPACFTTGSPSSDHSKDALLSSLSAAVGNVVTTLCSCLYGGAKSTTIIITQTAPQPLTISTITTASTSISFTATSITTITVAQPPFCYCNAKSGLYCRLMTDRGEAAGACAQNVPATGPNDPYYCYYQDDGCPGKSFECRSNADCAPGGRSRANSGSIYCYKVQDGRNCNVCGSNKTSSTSMAQCPNPPDQAARLLRRIVSV